MNNRILEEIRASSLFANTTEAGFATLTRGAYVQTFPPMMDLATEGDLPDFLYILASGNVELFARWNGRETTMGFLHQNDTFILAATIRDRPFLMSARTLTKSRLIMIPSADVREAFESDPEFAKAIVEELAGCYRKSVKQAKSNKLRTSTERLANYLLRQSQKAGGASSFELPQEKKRLAAYLGMTPENLSRSMSSLREQGVECKGQKIRLNDVAALTEFAKPDPLIDSQTT